ncbi:MAG: DUF1937 family protein [Candidatus Puniceispirillaceae bacterium]
MNFTTIKIARDLSKTETFFLLAASCKDNLVYLASPFKSEKVFQPYKGVPEWVWRERAAQTAIVTEWLLNNGIWAFSPIVYGMHIEEMCGSHDSGWWLRRDFEFFKKCDVFAILALAGWEESPGVQKEIEWALTTGKTIFKLELEDGFFDEETTASAEFHRKILGNA